MSVESGMPFPELPWQDKTHRRCTQKTGAIERPQAPKKVKSEFEMNHGISRLAIVGILGAAVVSSGIVSAAQEHEKEILDTGGDVVDAVRVPNLPEIPADSRPRPTPRPSPITHFP